MIGEGSGKVFSGWLADHVETHLCAPAVNLKPYLSSEPGASVPFVGSHQKAGAYLESLIHCHQNPNVRAVIESLVPEPIDQIAESLVSLGRCFPALQIAILNEQYSLVADARYFLEIERADFPLDEATELVRSMISLRLIEALRIEAQTASALKLAMSCAVIAEDQIRGEGAATGDMVDWHTAPNWVVHPYSKNDGDHRSKVRFYDLFTFYRGMILRDHPQAIIHDYEISDELSDESTEKLSTLGIEAVEKRRFKDICRDMRKAALQGTFGR